MIDIKDKKECCGCRACVQICPEGCISFLPDIQGFCYPKVDLERCIHCNLCERVCPVINQSEPKEPIQSYAARTIEEDIVAQSSSGGVFYAIAKKVIDEGGVVFGARFNSEWKVEHGYAETIEDVKSFIGSKYVQSDINESYKYVEEFLKEDRNVLFSGTSCQVAGLKRFLKKDYSDKLFIVDVLCHGVPSPLIFRSFINSLINNVDNKVGLHIGLNDKRQIKAISLRDKENGWMRYGTSIIYSCEEKHDSATKKWFIPNKDNSYIQAFIRNFSLRPSCFKCCAKSGKSNSDITLGDFWGIPKEYPKLYKRGLHSLVIVNSDLGLKLLASVGIEKEIIDFSKAIRHNAAYSYSASMPPKYREFWSIFSEMGFEGIEQFLKRTAPSKMSNVLKKIIRRLKRSESTK